jgi:NADPH-dependent curcumin reductase CurA
MTSAATLNRQLRLASRPKGPVEDGTFAMHEEAVLEPGEGEFLVRTIYVAIAPAQRSQLIDVPSYVPPVQIGERMRTIPLSRRAARRPHQRARCCLTRCGGSRPVRSGGTPGGCDLNDDPRRKGASGPV